MKRLMIALFASALALVAPALGKPGPPSSSVTIAASANPIGFGFSTLISGQATGKKAAGSKVDLQVEPFPFTSFSTVSTTTADATGHYSFTVAPGVNTIYRVMAKTAPSATSANLLVKVLVKVTLRVSTTKPALGQLVRFSGFVLPAYTGKIVLIQRKTAPAGGRSHRPSWWRRRHSGRSSARSTGSGSDSTRAATTACGSTPTPTQTYPTAAQPAD